MTCRSLASRASPFPVGPAALPSEPCPRKDSNQPGPSPAPAQPRPGGARPGAHVSTAPRQAVRRSPPLPSPAGELRGGRGRARPPTPRRRPASHCEGMKGRRGGQGALGLGDGGGAGGWGARARPASARTGPGSARANPAAEELPGPEPSAPRCGTARKGGTAPGAPRWRQRVASALWGPGERSSASCACPGEPAPPSCPVRRRCTTPDPSGTAPGEGSGPGGRPPLGFPVLPRRQVPQQHLPVLPSAADGRPGRVGRPEAKARPYVTAPRDGPHVTAPS